MRRYAAGDRVMQAQYGAGTIVDVNEHIQSSSSTNTARGVFPRASSCSRRATHPRRRARRKRARRKGRGTSVLGGDRNVMSVRLFVGDLPYSATEADIRQHFGTVGDPMQVVI